MDLKRLCRQYTPEEGEAPLVNSKCEGVVVGEDALDAVDHGLLARGVEAIALEEEHVSDRVPAWGIGGKDWTPFLEQREQDVTCEHGGESVTR